MNRLKKEWIYIGAYGWIYNLTNTYFFRFSKCAESSKILNIFAKDFLDEQKMDNYCCKSFIGWFGSWKKIPSALISNFMGLSCLCLVWVWEGVGGRGRFARPKGGASRFPSHAQLAQGCTQAHMHTSMHAQHTTCTWPRTHKHTRSTCKTIFTKQMIRKQMLK